MFKKILFGLLALILIFCLISLFLPSKVHVERTATLDAPTSIVFSQVNNLKNWESWSPWFKMDPNMKLNYSGSSVGKGAKYSWESDDKNVGNGALTIVESIPNKKIVNALDFGDMGQGQGTWTFRGKGDKTEVTWAMDTDMGMNPMAKYMGLMMDGMVGPTFEDGLAGLDKSSQEIKRKADVIEQQQKLKMEAASKAAEIKKVEPRK